MDNEILISLFFHATEFFIKINRNKSIYDLINKIITKFNINIAEYDLIYDNKPLPLNRVFSIYELVGDNENPPFMLKKKNSSFQEKPMATVFLENFPSFIDLQEQIKYYIQNIGDDPNFYEVEFRNASCRVRIPNSKKAIRFIQYMNSLRLTNDLYFKMNIKFQCADNTNLIRVNNFRKVDNSRTPVKSVYRAKKKSVNKSFDSRVAKLSSKSALNIYFSNQKYIRSSSPYLSPEEKRRLEDKMNKLKWITPQGFISSVGNYSSKYKEISNYVNETPSQSPLNYDFRPVNKSHWIGYRDFMV